MVAGKIRRVEDCGGAPRSRNGQSRRRGWARASRKRRGRSYGDVSLVGKLNKTPGTKSTATLSTVMGPVVPGGRTTVTDVLSARDGRSDSRLRRDGHTRTRAKLVSRRQCDHQRFVCHRSGIGEGNAGAGWRHLYRDGRRDAIGPSSNCVAVGDVPVTIKRWAVSRLCPNRGLQIGGVPLDGNPGTHVLGLEVDGQLVAQLVQHLDDDELGSARRKEHGRGISNHLLSLFDTDLPSGLRRTIRDRQPQPGQLTRTSNASYSAPHRVRLLVTASGQPFD